MTEKQLERRANIAKACWWIATIPLFVMAAVKIDLGFLFIYWGVWLVAVIPLRHYFPDDFDRLRARQGF